MPDLLNVLATPGVDGTDPLVVALTWLLTYLVGRFAPEQINTDVREWLPAIALVTAIGGRAFFDAVMGDPLTLETAFRGFAAGAVAVAAHSQVREVQKGRERKGKRRKGKPDKSGG